MAFTPYSLSHQRTGVQTPHANNMLEGVRLERGGWGLPTPHPRSKAKQRGKTEEWDRILAGGPEEHRAGTPDVNKAQQTPFFRRAVAQQTPPFSFCWASGSSCDLPNHPLCYGVAGFGSSAERHKLRGQALN